MLVDHAPLVGERRAGAELLEDAVHPGDREVGAQRVLALATRVEIFAEEADARALEIGGDRKRGTSG